MNYSKVTLVGRLVKDPVHTVGNPEKQVDNRTFMQVAVNRSSAKDSPYDVFNVVLWAALADIAFRFCKKGKEVLIEGCLRTNNKKVVAADGTVSWSNYTEVVAKEIQLGHDAGPREEKQEPAEKTPEQLLQEVAQTAGVNPQDIANLIARVIISRRAQQAQAPGQPEEGSYTPDGDFPM
jgi:single-stranded DNA-binding protein